MPTTLKTRATPKQERARRRVDQIMSAAVQILSEQPPSDLSAVQIATRAKIPVSSIYRYFPTIEALTEELYLQAAATLNSATMQAIDGHGPWRERVRAALALLGDFLADHPYYRPLLILIATRRGPQSLSDDFNHDLVDMLTRRWAAGRDGFHGGDPALVAATVVQIALSLEELIMQHPPGPTQTALFTEMTRAVERYLALYLSDDTSGDPI